MFARYIYYPAEATLLMTLPRDDHQAIITAYERMMMAAFGFVEPPEKLLQALDGGALARGRRVPAGAQTQDLDSNKYPDSNYALRVSKTQLSTGPMEVGSSQSLHGKKGVLMTVSANG